MSAGTLQVLSGREKKAQEEARENLSMAFMVALPDLISKVGNIITRNLEAGLAGGPLAQSVERRADNAKVVSSRLTWTIYFSFFYHTTIFLLFYPRPFILFFYHTTIFLFFLSTYEVIFLTQQSVKHKINLVWSFFCILLSCCLLLPITVWLGCCSSYQPGQHTTAL